MKARLTSVGYGQMIKVSTRSRHFSELVWPSGKALGW